VTTGLVVFGLGERVFATSLDDVREIVRLQGLEPLPGMAPPLAGVIVLRGVPLPVLDVRAAGAPTDAGDVLVMTAGSDVVGVAVDAVHSVVGPGELPEAEASPASVLPAYVVGVRTGPEGPVLQVDLARLLDVAAAGWEAALGPLLPV